MTWTKFGAEFFDDCANAGLSDAATRTHAEAIGWLYRIDRDDLRIPKHLVRRFAGSPLWEDAVKELVGVEFWSNGTSCYVIDHHADIIRQSLAYQRNKKARDKKAQANFRKKAVGREAPAISADVSDYTVSQSDNQSAPTGPTDQQSERTDDDELDSPFLPRRTA